MCIFCRPTPTCGTFPFETPRLMLSVTALSNLFTGVGPARKTRQISEQTVNTIVDDALELDTLLSSDALSVRLGISGNVMRLDFEVNAETQEASKYIVHDVLSLFILAEKSGLIGARVSRAGGAILIVLGAVLVSGMV